MCSSGTLCSLIYAVNDLDIKVKVSNITSAIKIACDFISVEHLSTTIGLVSTFRQHRISTQSGDDVLQLYTTLLHAWFSLVGFHELYSKHPDMGSGGACRPYSGQYFYSSLIECDGHHCGSRSSAADVISFEEAMDVQADHAPPHVMPISSGPSLSTVHSSQSRRRRKAGLRRKGNLSCPVPSCMKENFARLGLLDHM